jgi:hypothetical protein
MSEVSGAMRIIALIEDDQIIQKILRHLGLWETNNHDPPARNPSQTANEPIGCIHRIL